MTWWRSACGARSWAPALWMLPVAFPVAMAFAGASGGMSVPLPPVEQSIAAPGIVPGGIVLFALHPPLAMALVIVAVFALYHGHAHGTEQPEAANRVACAAGFVVATGLLHLPGIGIGHFTKWPAGWSAFALRGQSSRWRVRRS